MKSAIRKHYEHATKKPALFCNIATQEYIDWAFKKYTSEEIREEGL